MAGTTSAPVLASSAAGHSGARPELTLLVAKTLDEVVGTPWAPTPTFDALRMPQVGGVHITLGRQIEHGGTKECPACFGQAKAQTIMHLRG